MLKFSKNLSLRVALLALAVTGGIASGKSTFCKIVSLRGFDVISADKIAHEILDREKNALSKIFKNVTTCGKIDRKKLAFLIFNNKNEREKLENFMHPLIREQIFLNCEILEKKQKPYFVEIPLFFETNQYEKIEKSILIYIPEQMQIIRLMKRDNLDKVQALQRLKAQMPIEQKLAKATHVIKNIGDEKHLEELTNKLLEELT